MFEFKIMISLSFSEIRGPKCLINEKIDEHIVLKQEKNHFYRRIFLVFLSKVKAKKVRKMFSFICRMTIFIVVTL